MGGKQSRLIGAILLVSGTTIGAGMLGLPVTTGLAGFFPALLIMTAVWLFMMLTALYLLEVNLRIKDESNLISMVHQTLGKPGEIVAWLTYLLLLYALTASYIVGCSQIVGDVIGSLIPKELPSGTWPTLIFLLFALFVYFGTAVVDQLNRLLMFGLVAAYLALIFFGVPRIESSFLTHVSWKNALPSLSVVATTFGYHIIIPTLTTYLERDVRLLKRAIIIGSLIPFVVYVVWQMIVMGVIPVYGEVSLSEAAHLGVQITFFLNEVLANPWLSVAIRLFAFFAIVTSLLGVTLSLSDFLADGLKIEKTNVGKLALILMTFVPPFLFALFYPQGFILALKYAGIFVVILLALLPALMAWFERRGAPKEKGAFTPPQYRVFGGKPLLMTTIVLSVILLGVEVFL